MTTALDVSKLSKDELVAELKSLGNQHRDPDSLKRAVAARLPGICITSIYNGPMFMGMAMSHHHEGTLSF